MGYRSEIVSAFPTDKESEAWAIIPEKEWDEVLREDGITWVHATEWKWYVEWYPECKKWEQFIIDTCYSDGHEDESACFMVVGEDGYTRTEGNCSEMGCYTNVSIDSPIT